MAVNSGKTRLPGLDGLRALAVLWVIFLHLWSVGALPRTRFWYEASRHGGDGVTVFFVLSGFLITWLLLREEMEEGRIHLGSFYLRRFLRILPPALAYLLCLRIMAAFGMLPVTWGDVGQAALFVRNIYTAGPGETIHYWTLAVEEQFYLVWPVMLLVMPKRLRLPATLVLVMAAPMWRYHVSETWPLKVRQYWRTDIVYDNLLIGCLLALLREHATVGPALRAKIFSYPIMLLAPVLAFALNQTAWGQGRGGFSLGASFYAVGIALAIHYVMFGRRFVVDRFLNWLPVVWVGRISYSLYLWQELFCYKGSGGQFWFRGFPQNVVLAFACAAGSFYLIERPFLRLRRRLAVKPVGLPASHPAVKPV